MGRETTALITWQGQSGEAKVLLETTELILRGRVKARFARGSITEAKADPSGLTIFVDGSKLHAVMSVAEAARWVKAIATPPPSLAAKLGATPDRPLFVQGKVDDPTLAEALLGKTTTEAERASQLLAVIEDEPGLTQSLALARAHPTQPLWCVYPKGKAANPGDTAIRAAFRAAGWMDNKVSAVSEQLTATRYTLKR